MNFLLGTLTASWDIFLDAFPYVLLGFFMAGILKSFVPDDFITAHLGKGSRWSIVKAALFGVPIPL
jgi:hypothetical protein